MVTERPIYDLLKEGTVIPAHPLALRQDLTLDEAHQRLLTRYYMASGAGGIAVAVHTTQFEIRKPEINLFEVVLKMASEEVDRARLRRPFIKVAGVCGKTDQAVREAGIAVKYGYHFGLLSLGGLNELSDAQLIEHVRAVADEIPVIGFYLQPAVGGRPLSYDFWLQFAEIKNVHAIKVAAFNRYQTLDVVRAVCTSSRRDEIALYTGNDDNIIADLMTPYHFRIDGRDTEKRFVGGLLGHWAVWTQKAVELLQDIKKCVAENYAGAERLLSRNVAVTDMNAAIFDPSHSFQGCIPGIHEVLFRQGLLAGTYCLDPHEKLSPGQKEEIDRIYSMYEKYTDEGFVKQFLLENK